MKKIIINQLKTVLNKMGMDIVSHYPSSHNQNFSSDFDEQTINTILKVKPFTMTSKERLFTLCESVRYVVKHQIVGDIVECGVWRGGSMMAVADTLLNLREKSRNLYLFDTFEGMTAPGVKDVSFVGARALEIFDRRKKTKESSDWCYASLDSVKQSVTSVGYPVDKIHFIQGKVEDTIPKVLPEKIAVLRLDTDWYESTLHELTYLFPKITPGGVIIIDDYGYWKGARQAVDEYFSKHQIKILLNRIDYTGRVGVVPFQF